MLSALAAGLFWAAIFVAASLLGTRLQRRRDRRASPHSYEVYTTSHDIEIRASELPNLLEQDGTVGECPKGVSNDEYDDRLARFAKAREGAKARVDAVPGSTPLCILLDMSGSMAERMPEVLGEIAAFYELATKSNRTVAVLGFTTRGWHGGLAREQWRKEGKRYLPGRLCALLHVVIADFDRPATSTDWEAILRPDVLRENVDGEALIWANEFLRMGTNEPGKLIILSDGAPVDDATLQHNDNDYLWRHLEQVVAALEADGWTDLHAIGLDHRVDSLFANSAMVTASEEIAMTLTDIATD